MTTKALINNIESFSTSLSAQQLTKFLDIMDEMAKMVEEAHALPANTARSNKKQASAEANLLH